MHWLPSPRFSGRLCQVSRTTLFYLPYAYYFPNLFDSAIWFSAILMAVAIIEFLVVMYVVPSVVLGNRDLVSAFRRSWTCIGKTWREMLGCTIVFGSIALGVMLIALAIGQSPLLLNHDYDFFLQISRGKILMTAACYGFVLACGILATRWVNGFWSRRYPPLCSIHRNT